MTVSLWPLLVHFLLALTIAATMLLLSQLLGERRSLGARTERYESGIKTTQSEPRRPNINFYLIATFFVIFDLELVFVLAWALVARKLGWLGFWEISLFIGVLLVALLYLWRRGALDWGSTALLKKKSSRNLRKGEADEVVAQPTAARGTVKPSEPTTAAG